MIDIKTLDLTRKPNQYLVAPEGWANATPHRVSPVFAMAPDDLCTRLRAIIAATERCEITKSRSVDGPTDNLAFEAVAKSKVFKFPDIITLRILPGPHETTSQIAIYARARYGYRDFGVNKARVDGWLAELTAQ